MKANIYTIEYHTVNKKKEYRHQKIVAESFESALILFNNNYTGDISAIRVDSDDIHLDLEAKLDVSFK